MKATLDDSSYSPASVAADPIVGVDRMLSEVAATHVVFNEPPASSEPPPEVVIDLTTTSDRPLLVVVIEDEDATVPAPPPPPQPPRADDVPVMQQAYAGDAGRVRYINNNLKTMKVAYTRRWVAETTTPSTSKPSTSDWTWSTTSSEMSSSLQAGIVSTIASQVRGSLAGRVVSRDDVSLRVLQEFSNVFRMAMQPEFQDSIVDEVLEPTNP